MAKMPIEWHRQCLVNLLAHLLQERDKVERAKASLERSESDFKRASDQLAEAERRGLDGYDADRFLVKRTAT